MPRLSPQMLRSSDPSFDPKGFHSGRVWKRHVTSEPCAAGPGESYGISMGLVAVTTSTLQPRVGNVAHCMDCKRLRPFTKKLILTIQMYRRQLQLQVLEDTAERLIDILEKIESHRRHCHCWVAGISAMSRKDASKDMAQYRLSWCSGWLNLNLQNGQAASSALQRYTPNNPFSNTSQNASEARIRDATGHSGHQNSPSTSATDPL
jgi:hypothetical protein